MTSSETRYSHRYDVFINFRGEDTRKTFTSHLHTALKKNSIDTYIDTELDKGAAIWPALVNAIENSRLSILVFSENYATSKWCLEELAKIMEHREDHGQIVIPVFYKIDPSHIRHQTGDIGKAFAKHERYRRKNDVMQVAKWRDALTKAANICGWDSQIHTDDSQIIQNIVNDVSLKLQLREPKELKGIVGTEVNCTKLESLMKEHKVIGIWGMGGIGKSTIAKVLFAKLFPQYDKVCFVANVKHYSHNMLLSELLKEEISTSNVAGPIFDSDLRKIYGKKVFIVLDNADMDNVKQLDFLNGEFNHLSPDSRLIVTTREKKLLIGRVNKIHPVDKWKTPESLELFCLKAFNQSCPLKGYEDLSNRAVKYAGGVPLVLEVLGSNLHSESTDFWKARLEKLNKYPDKKIQATLKVSYDGLDDLEKEIFLDIAFFFKGESKDRVIRILDACDFHAADGIIALERKALITISNSNIIQMHDLLQQMGFEIVRKLCSKDPGGHSRLRDIKEVRDVLGLNKGTPSVEGIILDLSQIKDLWLSADTFKKMESLRFLKFFVSSGQCPGKIRPRSILEPFSNKLRYFEWNGYPMASFSPPFSAKWLVEICMPHSLVKQLWQGTQELDYLERIDLSDSKLLIQLPDLTKAPRLKWVNLSGCESMHNLHPSVLSADTLVTLILDRCSKLESLKAKKHLKCLEKISVIGCSSLKEFAVSSDLMENLDLSDTEIETLDASVGLLQSLKWFCLEGSRLKRLPKELSRLTQLKELKLSNSAILIDKLQLHDLFNGLRKSLQILNLKGLSNMDELPDNIMALQQLQALRLDGSSVKSLPETIKHLKELEILSLQNCRELQSLPELPPLIKELYAVNCETLKSVSDFKTFATKMMGKTRNISFKNNLKMDRLSINCIMGSLHLTMMSAAIHNVSVRAHSYNYDSVEACFPGTKVPSQFRNRTTGSSITIELPMGSNILGFIYSLVLSPSNGVMKPSTKIQCQCLLEEETMTTWYKYNEGTVELKSAHVYVWYDPFHSDNILRINEPKVCFEFSLTTDAGEVDADVDGAISIKECGVYLITYSESYSVLPQLDLDPEEEEQLKTAMELETGCIRHPISILRSYDEKEGSELQNQMQNQQQWDLKSNSVLIVPELSAQVTSREVLFSDVEESIEFARISHRENTSEYSEAVNKVWFISKGNEGTQSECDAGLLLAVGSVSKEKLLLVPVQKPKGQYEDPLAVLKSILLGSQKPSPKAAYSTRNVNIGQAFHDLECLLEMSLDNIFRDIQLQQQLQISLECIKQASDENVSPSLMKLAKSMTSSIDETFENFSLTQKVVEDHTNRLRQKEKLLQQTTDAQKQRELLREKRNQYEVEAESIDKEAGKLDEEKQTLLKEALEKCDGEVKKLEDEAMNCIAESKELVLAIMSYESSYIAALSMQEKLNDNWGSFRTALAERHSSDQPQSCFQVVLAFMTNCLPLPTWLHNSNTEISNKCTSAFK